MYSILFKKSAVKELERLPSSAVKKIGIAIDSLAHNPRPDGCKKLSGSDENIWRIRVGDYRILYAIQDEIKVIDIRRIAHRKDVYR